MSDDLKSSTSKPRKTRPRILVVNNPGPDSSSSSDEEHIVHDFECMPVLGSMSTPCFTDRSRGPQPPHPPPLTTNLSEVSRPYPSSRSNPSNPALSSPSSTSSRAFESTPPPSTPGQSNHSEDLSNEGTVIVPYPDGSDITPPSATSRSGGVFNRLRFPRPGHARRSSNTTRPAASPTASIPESYTTQQSGHSGSRASPHERVTLLVTTDAEHLVTVDVTGANDAAFIRERIFTKLQIPDDDQKRYSIYRTEIGRFAIGDALTDEQLLGLYRERGDERGSIKLLVSHSHAAVHEPAASHEVNQSSPPVHTITPPVLPQHSYPPLRPRRRSRSRRGSVSSASERIPPDPAAGYEASVSDDLDHVEREPRRATIRALPQQPTAPRQPLPPPPPPPPRARSPGGNSYGRPLSPGGLMSPDRVRVPQDGPGLRPDWNRGPGLSTPPGSSPDVARSHDGFQQPGRAAHGRSGSDAALDRERAGPSLDYGVDQDRWRRNQEEDREKEERERRRRDGQLRKEPALRRAKVTHYEAGDAERRRGEWMLVPANVHSSGYRRERPTTPQDTRPSPSRHQNFSAFPLTRPPPPPPGTGDTRERSKRQAGKAVPAPWVIRHMGPQIGSKAEPPPPQSPPYNARPMKSTPDIRGLYKSQGASPGGRSQASAIPLPLKPGSSSSTNTIDHFSATGLYHPEGPSSYHDSPLHDMVTMKSGDAPRYPALSPSTSYHTQPPLSRPFGTSVQSPPQQGTNPYLFPSSSSASTQEPYPRPHSSTGNTPTTSPYRSPRTLQSPNGVDASSPETPQYRPSPQTSQSTGIVYRDDYYHSGAGTGIGTGSGTNFGPRPIPSHSRHERSNTDTLSTLEHATLARVPRTPPRSPISGRTPPLDPKPETLQVQRTLSSLPVQEDETPSSTESTVRRDEYKNIVRMLEGSAAGSGSGSNTVVPPRSTYGESNSHLTTAVGSFDDRSISSTASSAGHGSVSDDSDSESGTIWAIPPNKALNGSRPILAPIDTDSSPSSRTSSLPRENPRQPPLPGYIPDSPPIRRGRGQTNGKNSKSQRTSRFDNNFDVTWAPRPPPEEVLERLQEYFPEHDVDEPVIDAPSGGTSPTGTTAENAPMPAAEKRSRHKKSIRVVAAERRRIDRTTHVEPANNGPGAALRKRNTKLWGSRLEEVPTYSQAHLEQPLPSASDASPSTAKPIFRWVRGELIGKGTYGKVYLALNATTGEMIAVKQVEMPRTASDKNDSRQITVVEALKLESETLKDLDHPNIVQYLGFEETPTFLSIFLEYVPGGSIASCLRKHGKFDEDVTKSFTGQILSGLEYLHSKGILHRDMKADNILVETTGICKISDFGIAKRTDDINNAGAYTSMQGTVFWMAPEVIDGKKGYNSKIDIWSVGCVVFEMWTGQRPWNGKEAMAVLLQLYNTKQGPPVPSDINLSPLADDFRQKCFAMNPDERPSAAELRLHPYLELPQDWAFMAFK
ncbi:Pkinase-domain-containing protein [Phanerochaete sordida]|uniref:Pkinase-domain-containing protein n=1 Tax=Phanerochaete sordida TaxID=48140 RepID=A0A9P3G0Y7_9APHY|nr:Pkinase-domain-containing protein [Phanerochaete sordida]